MLRGLYTAYTGMLAQQQRMDLVSNNLANINTNGFKKDQAALASFSEVYTSRINDSATGLPTQIGKMSLGVRIDEVYTDHSQGSMKQTDDPFNIAIQGSGMIAVGELQGDGSFVEKYTRDGSFILDQKGQLVTQDGYFILSEDSEPIQLPSDNVRINSDASIYGDETLIGRIKLVDFEDMKTLRKQGDNLYNTTESSVVKAFAGTVEQGFLESSNVNSIEEMINMISVMRTYESSQKVITTYDATLEKAVNSVGALR